MPERRPLLKSFRTIGRVCDQVPALIFVMGEWGLIFDLSQNIYGKKCLRGSWDDKKKQKDAVDVAWTAEAYDKHGVRGFQPSSSP